MKKTFLATGSIIALLLGALSVSAQTQSRAEVLKEMEAKRAELAALERLFLSPSEEDQAAYAEFLRLPDTGLIRLLPREKYDTEVYKENKKTLAIRGGGAYYSFARLTHEYGFGSDIELNRDWLVSGFTGGHYGMLISLGDVSLEMVSLETSAVQDLAMDLAAKKPSQARLPLKLNSTYVVRSIDFRTSDVLVAFKVVRIDTDGSAILLWKLLKKFPAPQMAGKN